LPIATIEDTRGEDRAYGGGGNREAPESNKGVPRRGGRTARGEPDDRHQHAVELGAHRRRLVGICASHQVDRVEHDLCCRSSACSAAGCRDECAGRHSGPHISHGSHDDHHAACFRQPAMRPCGFRAQRAQRIGAGVSLSAAHGGCANDRERAHEPAVPAPSRRPASGRQAATTSRRRSCRGHCGSWEILQGTRAKGPSRGALLRNLSGSADLYFSASCGAKGTSKRCRRRLKWLFKKIDAADGGPT
jgi:hypothetical protein